MMASFLNSRPRPIFAFQVEAENGARRPTDSRTASEFFHPHGYTAPAAVAVATVLHDELFNRGLQRQPL